MSAAPQERPTGAENVIWDLSVFYDSFADPRLEADIERLDELAASFQSSWRGNLAQMTASDFAKAYQQIGNHL